MQLSKHYYRFWLTIVITWLLSARIVAHSEKPDSVKIATDSLPSFMIPAVESQTPEIADPQPTADFMEYSDQYQQMMLDVKRQQLAPINLPSSFALSPYLASWSGGGIYGSSRQTSINGMMGIESGTLNLRQSFGPLNVTAWADATKYSYFRGLQTGYGFGATIDLTLSEKWSLTLFGSYYTHVNPLSPAMAGYMNASNFGAYASYNFNDHWGISVGAQATNSLVTRRWEAQPMVMPYYRINKDVKIGIDVGGIIYEVAKNLIDSHNYKGGPIGPAVIAPPRSSPPPVAPRR